MAEPTRQEWAEQREKCCREPRCAELVKLEQDHAIALGCGVHLQQQLAAARANETTLSTALEAHAKDAEQAKADRERLKRDLDAADRRAVLAEQKLADMTALFRGAVQVHDEMKAERDQLRDDATLLRGQLEAAADDLERWVRSFRDVAALTSTGSRRDGEAKTRSGDMAADGEAEPHPAGQGDTHEAQRVTPAPVAGPSPAAGASPSQGYALASDLEEGPSVSLVRVIIGTVSIGKPSQQPASECPTCGAPSMTVPSGQSICLAGHVGTGPRPAVEEKNDG